MYLPPISIISCDVEEKDSFLYGYKRNSSLWVLLSHSGGTLQRNLAVYLLPIQLFVG